MAQEPFKAVILTALSVEYEAVRAFLSNCREDIHPVSQTIYERGEFSISGKTWEVGIVEIGQGNVDAAIETTQAINHFNPYIVLFVGIAGGIKDVKIGDVVASTKIYGYQFGKAEAEEFKARVGVAQSSYGLVQRARAEARKPDWLERLSEPPIPKPDVWVQPIAAGEQVVASTQSSTFQLLEHDFSDAVAVEMEGYGFSRAVYARTTVSSMVIRGISDLIDGKNDASQYGPESDRKRKASEHASAFAFQILAKFDPKPRLTGSSHTALRVEMRFWDELFTYLQNVDLAFLKTALGDVVGNREDAIGQIDNLSDLRKALTRFDDQDLAIAWVKHILERGESASNEETILTTAPALQTWYRANQPPEESEQEPDPEEETPPGYLLVTLDPVDDDNTVRLTAELHVDGKTPRTDFLPSGTTCSIEDVCEFLSDVIPCAGDVRAVEFFLPWQHLMQPVHDWKIRSRSKQARGRRNHKELWRIPRNTLIRSLDRLQDELWSEEWLKGLKSRLHQLHSLEQLMPEHICCCDCLTDDVFDGALEQKFLFKFLVTLPDDQEELASLLYEVVESKVPIWLWMYHDPSDADFANRVDALLTLENIKESAALAQAILNQRRNLQELGLLFDCHTRIPRLPNLAVDESGRLRPPAA